VKQLADGAGVAAATSAHGFLAENGEPLRKLASFKTALGEGSHVDIALMKFCYVDVNGDTDAKRAPSSATARPLRAAREQPAHDLRGT